jgi:histidyl-tRNA synthetase
VPGGAEAGAPLARTVAALEAMGLGEFVEVDLTIVRGLAYYTGTVFELFDAGRTLRALWGGGRYDDLLRSLGGVDLPALGFGMGDVVLAELIRERGLAPPAGGVLDVFVAAVTPEDLPSVLALAHELRSAGLRTEYALGATALGKQLKLADTRGAAWAVVIGPDDRARGEVMVKDLRPGGAGQQAVPTREAAAELARMAGERRMQGGERGHG